MQVEHLVENNHMLQDQLMGVPVGTLVQLGGTQAGVGSYMVVEGMYRHVMDNQLVEAAFALLDVGKRKALCK